MILDGLLSSAEAQFRAEVQAFLARELDADTVRATDLYGSFFPPPSITLPWQARLHARGWLAPHWPRKHGGAGWTPVQRFLFDTEACLAGAPMLAPFGLNYLGPVLVRFGTDRQRERFLPRILSGADYWCQGYSEPNAGSDLAGLQCAARRDGDRYIVRGTKLWTTHAQYANWIFCLVRTAATERPQHGISFLLIDMHSAGISVTPIVSISGEHEVNQVFFDDVEVPVGQLVGNEGDGWNIARYLLEFERGGFIMNGFIGRKLARCRDLVGRVPATAEGAELCARLAALEIDLLALQAAELRAATSVTESGAPGVEATALKVEFSELLQRVESLAVAQLGPAALAFSDAGADAAARGTLGAFLTNRATTIYGGSSEIQRDLIARNVVGL